MEEAYNVLDQESHVGGTIAQLGAHLSEHIALFVYSACEREEGVVARAGHVLRGQHRWVSHLNGHAHRARPHRCHGRKNRGIDVSERVKSGRMGEQLSTQPQFR